MKSKRLKVTVGDKDYMVTDAQLLMHTYLREMKLEPEFEVQVCADREWRFDIAIPAIRLAIECNGGKWNGGHRRGNKVDDENEKLNRAQLGGWRVLQFTNEFVISGDAKEFLKHWL